MAGDDDKITHPFSPKSSSPTSSYDKLTPFSVTSITNNMPVKLNLEKMNYNSWSSFFKIHLGSIGLKHHIESSTASSSDKDWSRMDDLVKVWILGTCSESLQDQVVTTPGTAKDLWDHIKDLFHDNEDARAITLDNQLRFIKIGNLSINAYFSQIQSMADRLKNLGGTVQDKHLVIYALNGLDSRYKQISKIIRHTKPLPTFATTKNMLLLEESEQQGESLQEKTHVDSSTSSPTILLAPNSSNGNRTNTTHLTATNSGKGTNTQLTSFCNHFSKRTCHFGDWCKFIHDHRVRGNNNATNGNISISRLVTGHYNKPNPMQTWNNNSVSTRHVDQPGWLKSLAHLQSNSPLLPSHSALLGQQARDMSIAHQTNMLAAAQQSQLAQQASLLAQPTNPLFQTQFPSNAAGTNTPGISLKYPFL
ncbi:hybrid signal transduction histidine kinase M [Artemisia annua]|uniref:Hybrid signal transduction histidine kinase M n=1 Tax=Artemisia annua TaxID=35608 RepID=A0A2U1P7B0_ARTAN|nr:hybrid signal transduction histidine kinase M [Artemisia annua]